MARSNKTSSVLKLVGVNPEIKKTDKPEQTGIKYNIDTVSENPESEPFEAGRENEETETAPKKRPRKTVIKKPKSFSLTVSPALNPVLKRAGADEPLYRRRGSERQIVNVSALLVCEQLGAAIERFKSCDCDMCCRAISEKAMTLMPDCFVRVASKPDEDFVNHEIKRLRPEAIKVLTKICITARARPYHNLSE